MKKRKREEEEKTSYLYSRFPFMRRLLKMCQDTIERVEETSLTISMFTENYDVKSRPCLILGSSMMRRKHEDWSLTSLSKLIKSNDKVNMMSIREPPERIAGKKRDKKYVKVRTVSALLLFHQIVLRFQTHSNTDNEIFRKHNEGE